jgi:hypothetical protein
MFYRSSREKASFRVALLENAREGFFLRRPRSAFFWSSSPREEVALFSRTTTPASNFMTRVRLLALGFFFSQKSSIKFSIHYIVLQSESSLLFALPTDASPRQTGFF